MDKDKIILELIAKVDVLTKRVQQLEVFEVENKVLRAENKDLKNRLTKYEHPKNSNNSSIPPSKDDNRPKRTSLREKSGLKPGGQFGRKGNTLKMVEVPDLIQKHNPIYCNCCGENLEAIASKYKGKRQVYDIPEIKINVTEHQIYTKQCECGYINSGDYPQEANAPVSYGNNIESLIGYFHTRQYIPFKRMKEIFSDVFKAPISEGGIHYILDKLVAKAQPAYDLIKHRLESNKRYAVGSDETGVKVNGDKHWAWTWQNEEATFITITDNRGQRSIDQTFKKGFVNSVLVHDCWASHFNTNAITHQICIAHLLRDLNYLTELYGHKWSQIIKLLFQSALNLKKEMRSVDYNILNPKRLQIEKRLNRLIDYDIPPDKPELIRFQKRMRKYSDYIFTFLYRIEVPPDNNASERAIRNIKIKQKVSGLFRSTNGAFRFAVLRSITDTVLKNDLKVLNSLKIIATL
ncbi:MAG: IS66 family transposase [Bacteroidales bacterium]|nr:IS66 family transposase [Bacteroidales bacterium]